MTDKKTIIIAGASGLVGGHLIQMLQDHPEVDRILSLVRRPPQVTGSKIEPVTVDFARLSETAMAQGPLSGDSPPIIDAAICALGTTQKKAGSKEAFRKVDFDFIVSFGELCRRLGVQHLHVISSIGAAKDSPSFYLRVKGETEQALKKLGIPVLSLYRPSLLLGEREEHRPAEAWGGRLMQVAKVFMAGPLKNYRPIEAQTVARAVVHRLSTGPDDGAGKTGRTARGGAVHVLESADIEKAAEV